MPILLLNATAIKSSGALTILKDCIFYLDALPKNEIEYHLFTTIDDFSALKEIKAHKVARQNWLARIIWDNGGLQRWCRINDLEPDLIISFQNTSTRFIRKDKKFIPQLVYYHQSLPLISHKWNILKKKEFILFLYAHFYSFFVTMNNKSSYYVVQLSYIRELFLRKFINVGREKVFVIRPNDPSIGIDGISEAPLNRGKFYFFYPAMGFEYKNHKIIIQALVLLKKRLSAVLNNIGVIFTLDKLEPRLMKLMEKHDLFKIIQLIGQIPYNEVLAYYKSVDALLFPSQFETFGLPLAEASCFGLPVIVANLPYAVEVLEKYDNKILIDPTSVSLWADALENYQAYKKILYSSPGISNRRNCGNSWSTFFDLANKIIKNTRSNNFIVE
jgi:glycosyltransferase involved in cell wall biosynthesis